MRRAAAIILLALLLSPRAAYAQGTAGTVIAFEDIPGILAPITLALPWRCGFCGPGVANLERWPDPDPPVSGGLFDLQINPLYPFQWLAVQLWNNVAYPIICWMLAALQALLNAFAGAWNLVIVAGINFFWRLLISFLLWSRESFLAAWSWIGWLRLVLWDMLRWLLQLGEQISAFVRLAGQLLQLAGDLLLQLGALILAGLQALLYLAGLFFAIIPALITAVLNPVAPPQIATITSFFLFQWFIDIFRAIADSSLGWAWAAFVVLTYARFALWLVDELATLNQ